MKADFQRPEPAESPLLENLLVFVRALRRAGLTVSLDQAMGCARGLGWVDLGRRQQVFHTLRSLLVTRREDLALFDALFHRFFHRDAGEPGARGQKAPPAPRHDLRQRPFTVVNYMAHKARDADREIEVTDRSGTFSDVEVLQNKDFSRLSEEEAESVRRLIGELRWRASLRRTRRWAPDDRGRSLDLRRALRAASRTGLALELPRRRRKVKPRPLVLLADISGSMEKISRLVLLFFHSLAQGLAGVESFVFGTRLTRITAQLAVRNVDRALEEASREVVDWAGGTRIGESLQAFNRRWGRRVLRRGAVVLVISDGWERGAPELLSREMRHLQLRCHRLIWLNPLLGQSGYRPLVRGMAASLPYVDDFLPVHNLQSLHELAEHLRRLPTRRRGRSRRDQQIEIPENPSYLHPSTRQAQNEGRLDEDQRRV